MNRIRELRAELGMNQEQLAYKLLISRSAVAMYETNRRDLSTELIADMCHLFGCSSDYLLCLSDERGGEKPAVREPDDRLLIDVTALSADNRQRLEDYLRLLLASQGK